MKAAILVGGYGKRLRPFTDEKPKSLLIVAAKPILAWQIEWLKKCGVNEMVFCVGYLKEKIIEHVGGGTRFGLRVGYVVEESPLGTGGALRNAEAFLKSEEKFLVVNGDIITDLDPARMVDEISGPVGRIALVPLKSPYGIVDTDKEGFARRFREKPIIPEYWINAGVYCFKPEIFDYLPEKGNIETATFPKLAKESKLKAFKYQDVFWRSIETQKDMEEAEASLKATKPR
jgi:NDP-sugar pyrophosphorylase family protein